MNFELACLEDFNEIENLYWDLIDKSKEEPSFPDWEKGVHPSADFLMAGIVKKELFVLRDEGIIKACAIVNSNSNKEYKKVAWKVNGCQDVLELMILWMALTRYLLVLRLQLNLMVRLW